MSTQETNLKAIADAIREKEGSMGPIPANAFAERILAIETGGKLPEDIRVISLTADPPEGGNLYGGGFASDGMTLTIEANARDGFKFSAWQENGLTISEIETYKFLVNNDHDLVAVFADLSKLPDGYTRVKYIESNGFSYIDTGVKPTSAAVTIDFEPLETNTTEKSKYVVFSNYIPSSGNRYFYMLNWTSSGVMVARGSSSSSAYFEVLSSDITLRRMVAGIDYPNKKAFIVGEAELKLVNVYTRYDMRDIRLFGATDAESCVIARLYSCQISTAGTLVRDFAPCINPSGSVGLYDLVTGTFYANGGTEAFTAGPAV